ncbi:hypothetical protein RYX36_012457, partial [Vicia faba]
RSRLSCNRQTVNRAYGDVLSRGAVREKDNSNKLKDEINHQISQARVDIEDYKKQLDESKVERWHKEECEVIKKLIALQPPRCETQKVITELVKEIAVLDAENTTGSRLLEPRKKKFSLLLHVVDELQNTIEENKKRLMEESFFYGTT